MSRVERVAERVFQCAAEQAGVSVSSVRSDSHIVADLGMDSLDIIEFLMAIEEEFEIEIADEDAERCSTVGDVIELVKKGGAA